MDIQVISAIIFVILLGFFIFRKRKHIVIQKILYPFLYLILYRSNFGINFMNKFAKKYKEYIIFFGYCCIGIGILGMIFISINIIFMIWALITSPVAQPGVALVLPFTNVPGVGYLSFFHWIIAIFILAIVHEFAHGIVARAHGLPIKSSGFAFFALLAPIIPAAFVEPDESKLQKEPDAVKYSIFAAGPIINIVLAFIIFLTIMPGLTAIENRITDPSGLSFNLLNESYPATQAGMEKGIITELNGEKVVDYDSFINALYGVRPNEEVNVITDKGSYTIITAVSPDNPKKGFIGIVPVKNERTSKPKYAWLNAPFSWTKDLFKWLFLLNLFIGLFNLLPLGIVDGGRILGTLLNNLISDKKKAKRLWSIISLFFLLLLLFGLASTYLGNPFAFLFN